MAEESVESSSRSMLRDMFHRPADAEVDTHRLFGRIVGMLDNQADSDELAACVDQLRRSQDVEFGSKLDHLLLKRIADFSRAKKELEDVHNELQEKIQRLLSPPFFPARYLGSVATQNGQYATVSHDGNQRVVAFAEELSAADLDIGDKVFLSRERNVMLAKAPCERGETGETAAFVRRTEDGHLVLSDRDTEVVVSVSRKLGPEKLRPGDLMLWDRPAHMALRRLEPGEQVGYEDYDETSPQQLGGLNQMCDQVMSRFVFSIIYPDLAREYQVMDDGARRLLLKGPPGTGKTTLMRMIAARIAQATSQHCRVVTISGAQLYSSYVGETERNIRRCFAVLNDYDGPGIVFFDEIDAIGRVRGNISGYHDDRFLGTLLAELEGMHRTNVAVIAATNRSDTLDSALRSRFAWEIEMPRPDKVAAMQIFAIHMPEDLPYQFEASQSRQDLIDTAVSHLYQPNADNKIASLQFRDGKQREVVARELVSGRLFEQICNCARSAAFERRCRGGEPGLSVEDMQTATADAIERLRQTLTVRNVSSYLSDLPQDIDVVSVQTIRPRVNTARYTQ